MTIRTRPHRHERIKARKHAERLNTLKEAEGFAPNQPRTSYLVSAPSKERGRLGYHHYKKQLRRLCTFHGEHQRCKGDCKSYVDTSSNNQGVKATFKKPSPIINLTTSEVKLVKKFKSIDKSNQSNSVGSFGYDFGQDWKLIKLVADHIEQPIQEMHSLDDDIVRECVRSFLASKTE
jgi:anthranilate/para-aminobenzoate synthase component I